LNARTPSHHADSPARPSRLHSATAAALLLLSASAVCAAPDDSPTATVRTALDRAAAISASGATGDARLDALRPVARDLVDTRPMGQRALGAAFAKATPAQQEEFLSLFAELFIRSYLQKLLLFREPKYRFGKEERHDDTVTVTAQIVAGADSYNIDYEMHREGDRWLATDIAVEGVSMTSNYSDQFTSLLRTHSFDELLDLMRRKVGQSNPTPGH
jgi:phospholipid transport system substrate-binding protein